MWVDGSSSVLINDPLLVPGASVAITGVYQDGSSTQQVIKHAISDASAPNFRGISIPTAVIEKIDDDAAGIVITPVSTLSSSLTAFEGGAGTAYTVALSRAPPPARPSRSRSRPTTRGFC